MQRVGALSTPGTVLNFQREELTQAHDIGTVALSMGEEKGTKQRGDSLSPQLVNRGGNLILKQGGPLSTPWERRRPHRSHPLPRPDSVPTYLWRGPHPNLTERRNDKDRPETQDSGSQRGSETGTTDSGGLVSRMSSPALGSLIR